MIVSESLGCLSYPYVYVSIKNLHIKIAGYAMNGPKFQLDLMIQ